MSVLHHHLHLDCQNSLTLDSFVFKLKYVNIHTQIKIHKHISLEIISKCQKCIGNKI